MHQDNHGARGFRGLLGERLWAALVAAGVPRSHHPGEFLLRQGDKGDHLIALTTGRVKILAGVENGSQLLLSLRGAGDLVGEMASRPDAYRTATVQALEHGTSCHLHRRDFEAFLDSHGAEAQFRDYIVDKLCETVPYQVQQAHFTPRQRVARLILETVLLADPRGKDRAKVPFSQEALATALGMARSTVADQVARLRSSGALASHSRLVVADERVLAAEAGTVVRHSDARHC